MRDAAEGEQPWFGSVIDGDRAKGDRMASEEWTYFHLPDAEEYVPWQPQATQAWGGSVEGYVMLPDGAEVTLHAYDWKRFRVKRSHFHVGHDDEAGGMHIYLVRQARKQGRRSGCWAVSK